MKINEILNEANDYATKRNAHSELETLYNRTFSDNFKKKKAKPIKDSEIEDVLKKAKELLKISGRTFSSYDSHTSGFMYDTLTVQLKKRLAKITGKKTFPSNSSTTGFAKELAGYFDAQYRSKVARKWTSSLGGSYVDPSDYVMFNTEEARDSAWEELQEKGKKIYVKDSPSSPPRTYVKIGSLLITTSSTVFGVFSDKPTSEYGLTVQTTKILKNSLRSTEEITDQQASSLQDIASTKNANAIEKIKLIMALFKGEEEVADIINNSKKITMADKKKLDKIIKDAQRTK